MHLGQHQKQAQRGTGGPWFCHQETWAGVEKHTGLTGTLRRGGQFEFAGQAGEGVRLA